MVCVSIKNLHAAALSINVWDVNGSYFIIDFPNDLL